MTPKGKLVIIGSPAEGTEEPPIERKKKEFQIGELLGQLMLKKKDKRIEVITASTDRKDHIDDEIIRALYSCGFTDINYICYSGNSDENEKEYINRVNKANAVLLGGKNQSLLTSVLKKSKLLDVVIERYNRTRDFMVAGRTACKIFDFCRSCIIDTEFIRHGQFKKLAEAVLQNPEALGIGLGEDALLMIRKGNVAECLGPGNVTILDAHEILKSSLTDATDRVAVYMEHLVVHLLSAGRKFFLSERCFE